MFNKRQEQLRQKFPNETIDTVDILEINGIKLFNRKQLSELLTLSQDRIKDYENQGMPRSEYSLSNYILYDLRTAVDWIVLNVDLKKSKRVNSRIEELPEEIDEHDWESRKKRADALIAEEKAKIEEIKYNEIKKQYVSIEKTDIAMAEQAAVYLSDYRDDLKLLPVMLEGKKSSEIKAFLDEHYKKRTEEKLKLAQKKIKVKNLKIFDKLKEFISEAISE